MRKEAVKAPSNPKGHQRKSEEFPEEGVPFSNPGKGQFPHHVCHAIHHNFTTIYHHETHQKRKNPQ
jgi:hypothetical protein